MPRAPILPARGWRALTLAPASFAARTLPALNCAKLSPARANFTVRYLVAEIFHLPHFLAQKMRKAILTEIYAAGAIFVGADLTDTDIQLANFSGAISHGADFSAALNATAEQLAAACADSETKLPEGVPATRC